MSKYIFKTVPKDVLVHHNMVDTSKVYYVSAYGGLLPVYLAQDPTKRGEIHEKLCKPTQDTLVGQGYNKAFVLPNCSAKLDRVKECLKEHNIRMTTDLDDADVVISHMDIEGSYESGANINSKMLLCKLWNYYGYHVDDSQCLLFQREKDENTYNNTWDWDEDQYESLYEIDYFTGYALELAYRIDVENLPVVGLDTLLNESATRQILTHELLTMINSQINAGDEDRQLAYKLLPTIHPDKNHHLLWQLAQNHSGALYYAGRDKDLKYWMQQARIDNFGDYSAEQMIIWLKENNLLTSEAFRYIEPIVRKLIEIYNRELYVFKVAVKPEYREYLKVNNNE